MPNPYPLKPLKAIQAVQLERDEGQEEIDQLSQALIHARSELEEWEKMARCN